MKSYYQLICAFALCSLAACNSKQVEYLPFQESEDGYWGLIDRKGKVLFADEFENEIISVNEGILCTTDDEGLYQYYTIEKKPKLIAEGYKDAGSFHDGLAPVVEKGEWVKFINKKGKVVFELKEVDGKQVEWVSDFHFGIAIYHLEDGSNGLINTKGKLLTEPRKVGINFCTEGGENLFQFGRVVDNENLIIEYADATLLINYKDFIKGKNGKALYRMDDEKQTLRFYKNSKYYCVDTKKKHIIMDGKKEALSVTKDSKNDCIYDIKGKHLLFSNENGDKRGVMDMKGNIVIRPKYAFLHFMDENTFICSTNGKDVKIIDSKSNVINDDVDFSENLYYKSDFYLYDGVVCLADADDEYYFADQEGEPIGNDTYYNLTSGIPFTWIVTSDLFNVNKLIRELQITETGVGGISIDTSLNEFIKLDIGGRLYYELDEEELLDRYYNENELDFYIYLNGLKVEFYPSFSESIVTREHGYKDWNENCELTRLTIGFYLTGEYQDKGNLIFGGLYDFFLEKCEKYIKDDGDASFRFSNKKDLRLIHNKEENFIAIHYFNEINE